MKFMMLIKHTEDRKALPKELSEAIGKLSEHSEIAPVILVSGGLAPTAASSRVRISGGKLTVTDGPFVETKEVVGGFAILEFKSREEAVESARQYMELYCKHWPGWEGETEVRQVYGPEDYTLEAGRLDLKPDAQPGKA
jgi:hypothetical protein